jgi:hypothetical protein
MRWNIKPSKPVAVLSAVVGVAMLVVALTSIRKSTPFLILWIAIIVAIVGFNLWSAFSSGGSLYSVSRRED